MPDAHDLNRQVIAILDSEPEVRDAVTTLDERGFRYEVMQGEEGREHLDPSGEDHGVFGAVERLAKRLGDEQRILERLDRAVADGNTVIAVYAEDDAATEAVEILKDHGGSYLWRFGQWSHVRVGED
jgi:hypothetical protein